MKCVRSSSQTFTTATPAALQFPASAEAWDTDGFHSDTNNTRMIVPAGLGGRYVISGFARFAADSTGNRIIYLYLNGVSQQDETVSANVSRNVSIDLELALSAGDYIEVFAYQNSGGDLTATGWGSMRWVSR